MSIHKCGDISSIMIMTVGGGVSARAAGGEAHQKFCPV